MDKTNTGNLTVEVRLHDSIVGRGVTDVSVRIVSTKLPARHFESPAMVTEKTSFRGDALFKNIPLGPYDFHVEAEGYASTTLRRVTVGIPGPDPQGHFVRPNNVVRVKLDKEKDAEIESLDLGEIARKAAYELKKAHPSIKFTSGRRTKDQQAEAMASNVMSNRKWIEQTYSSSAARTKCQEWIDKNPDKKTHAEIKKGLVSVFSTFTDADLGKFSKHLSGDAFDVQPVSKNAEAIKKTIRGLPGLTKFLETEGGLVRWHAQF